MNQRKCEPTINFSINHCTNNGREIGDFDVLIKPEEIEAEEESERVVRDYAMKLAWLERLAIDVEISPVRLTILDYTKSLLRSSLTGEEFKRVVMEYYVEIEFAYHLMKKCGASDDEITKILDRDDEAGLKLA